MPLQAKGHLQAFGRVESQEETLNTLDQTPVDFRPV